MALTFIFGMFFDGEWDFLLEIILRSLVMFLLILVMLRISGRRGVRQLTLFEVAIILGLGSAAGDPMFQEDLPIVHAILVFLTVILLYKGITWLSAKSAFVNKLMEGDPLVIVRNGTFAVTEDNVDNFSKMEFFAELRNESVEHLGQVRTAVLEIDGSISIIRYAPKELRYGLPLFPDDYKEIQLTEQVTGHFACMLCGRIETVIRPNFKCPTCGRCRWTHAIRTEYH